MDTDEEIRRKGLVALNKTVSLFENTHDLKLFLVRIADGEIIKGNQIVNIKSSKVRPVITSTHRRHYIFVK